MIKAVALFLRAVLYGWIPALCGLVRNFCQLIRAWIARCRIPERQRKTSDSPCVPIRSDYVPHPDPMLYSQDDLMRRGLAVTWDNPDIQLYRDGAPVSSSDLDPGTTYDVVARIWNKSTAAPVVGLPVRFSVAHFGIGGVDLTPIALAAIPHLGVKGDSDNPAFCAVKWTTPTEPGHYCIQVNLEPVDDADHGNNHGAENTQVGAAHSPAEFEFRLGNDTNRTQTFRFEVDSYVPPRQPPCAQRPSDTRTAPRDRAPGPMMPGPILHVPAEHDRRNYPVPDGWTVTITPPRPVLEPEQSITVRVAATPPPTFHGRQPLNINGFHERGLAGGITLYVNAD